MKKRNILLVDDDHEIATLLATCLTGIEISVSIAHSVREASEMMQNNSFDIAIIDCYLPDCQGTKLMQDITSKYPNILIISITGNKAPEIKENALKNGAAHHIVKHSAINFLEELEKLLEHHSNQKQTNQHVENFKKIQQDFWQDIKEKLPYFTQICATLEKQRILDKTKIKELYREVHSINSLCKIADYMDVAQKVDDVEEILLILQKELLSDTEQTQLHQALIHRLDILQKSLSKAHE